MTVPSARPGIDLDLERRQAASLVGDVVVPGAVVLLLFSGIFKANPLLSWLPIDLTLLAALATATCLAAVFVTHGVDLRLPLGALALAAAMVPGILLSSDNPYAVAKVSGLALTAAAALGAYYLVRTPRRTVVWVWLHVLVGVVLAVGTLLTPSSKTIRVALDGANTIESGRAAGIGVVVLVVLAMMQRRLRLLLLAAAATLLYFVVASGSRGPLLAAAVAVLLVALTVPGRGRGTRILLVACVGVGVSLLVDDSTLSGAGRIRDTVAGREESVLRELIWKDTIALIPQHPFGVGWGDFWTVQSPGARHTTTFVQYSHNVVLEASLEGGWVAGIAVTVFIAASLWRLHRLGGVYGSALYAIGVFFVVNAMVSEDINGNRAMWAALAIAWAMPAGFREHRAKLMSDIDSRSGLASRPP